MDANKNQVREARGDEEVIEEKVIKVGLRHYQILKTQRDEVNRDESFKKKISMRRFVEKLIEDYAKKCVPDLIQEREQSEDWLRIEHKKKAPDVPFFDWLKSELSSGNRAKQKRERG